MYINFHHDMMNDDYLLLCRGLLVLVDIEAIASEHSVDISPWPIDRFLRKKKRGSSFKIIHTIKWTCCKNRLQTNQTRYIVKTSLIVTIKRDARFFSQKFCNQVNLRFSNIMNDFLFQEFPFISLIRSREDFFKAISWPLASQILKFFHAFWGYL